MSGYPEGKHDEPVGSSDRLVRIGSRYQADPAEVADGDNIYLLVDSLGRVLISGAAPSNTKAVGNPVQIGGTIDDLFPRTGAEGDVRTFRATSRGNQIVELYKDNTPLLPLAAMPGASEVKSATASIGATSVDRATLATPAAGKRIRIVSLEVLSYGLATDPAGVYFWFGTGARFTTTAGKAIASPAPGVSGSAFLVWPDGAGPLGGVNDVVSWNTQVETETGLRANLHYREE